MRIPVGIGPPSGNTSEYMCHGYSMSARALSMYFPGAVCRAVPFHDTGSIICPETVTTAASKNAKNAVTRFILSICFYLSNHKKLLFDHRHPYHSARGIRDCEILRTPQPRDPHHPSVAVAEHERAFLFKHRHFCVFEAFGYFFRSPAHSERTYMVAFLPQA